MEFRRLFITSARQCVKCKNMTHGDNIPAMGVPVMPQYINQLPLLTLIIIPLCSALYGIRKINLKSVIHFQQGTQSSSAWRVAVAMNVFSIPSFTIWCLFIRGLSALFFQGGALLATAMTLLSVSNILHYIPSPSIFVYPQQRYQSKTLRFWLSLLQSFSTLLYALLILLHSSSFIASVTNNSVYLVIPLIAYFSVFTVVFSGHSSIMNMSLLINIMCWLSGFGLLLYFGIEEASSFRTFVPSGFSLSDSLISLAVGFLVSIYQLTASPLMYQIYFPLSTVHKLRLSFILHGVFQLFTAILVFIIVSLFVAFLEKHCNLQYSYSSFFQFTKFILPHTLESYIVVASFLSVVLFSFQWLLFSLSSHLWEEFIKDHFKDWSPIKQLCSFQVVLFLLATLLVTLTTIIRFLRLPFEDITTTAVLALLLVQSLIFLLELFAFLLGSILTFYKLYYRIIRYMQNFSFSFTIFGSF